MTPDERRAVLQEAVEAILRKFNIYTERRDSALRHLPVTTGKDRYICNSGELTWTTL